MSITLDTQTVQSLVTPRGMSDPLVSALFVKREQKVLVNLVRLLQKLEQESPDLVQRTGFRSAIQQLTKYPAVIQKQVLRYSSVRFWVEVAWGLVYKQSHMKFPELHIETHLRDFWRITLACAWLAQDSSFVCDVMADKDGRLSLPGTHCYIESAQLVAYARVHVQSVDDEWQLQVNGQQIDYVVRQVPQIHHIELNAVDHDHRLNGRTSFEYEVLDDASIVKWQSVLEESMAWIAQANAKLYEEIVNWTTAFVPVVSKSVEVHLSATFHQSPSIMALSWTPDSTVMSEAIVHEYHHQKLNALMDVTDLMAGAYGEAIYYSPWRPDPRPLSGIYHGAFVFQAVLEYWHDFFRQGVLTYDTERVQQRMHLVSYQTAAALGTLLTEAELTDIGKSLVEGMQANLDMMSESLPDIGEVIESRIRESMTQHRETWLSAHQGSERARAAVVQTVSQSGVERTPLQQLAVALGVSEYSIHILPHQLQGYFVEDVILNKVVQLYDEQQLGIVNDLLKQCAHDNPLLSALIQGHMGYIKGEYVAALSSYSAVIQLLPSSAYAWSLAAFTLRHIGELEVAHLILANLGMLVTSPTAHNQSEQQQRYQWAEMRSSTLVEIWRYVDAVSV